MQPSQSEPQEIAVTDAGTVVVEAESAAAALAQVQRTHGAGARILQAEKVRRGGIGGFFAKELVQLTVAPEGRVGVAPEGRVGVAPEGRVGVAPEGRVDVAPQGAVLDDPHAGETFGELLDRRAAAGVPAGGLAGVLAELTAATDHRESTFGDALRAAVGPLPTPEAPQQQEVVRPATASSLLRGARPVSDPRLANGATMLAATAERVAHGSTMTVARPVAATRPADEVDHAEAVLDAAVRAVTAGTTAGTVLRAAEQGEPTNFEPLRIPPADAPVPASAPTHVPAATGAVATDRWSEERLRRLGLPDVVVRSIVGQHPRDDISWLTATARAMEPLCAREAVGDVVLVGPMARRVASVTDARLVRLTDAAPRRGSLALACSPSERALSWLDRGRRGRPLHLVVGGNGWRDWVWQELGGVAWAGPESLVDAITLSVQLGLPLTGAPDGDRFLAATPVDVAVAVRGLLEP